MLIFSKKIIGNLPEKLKKIAKLTFEILEKFVGKFQGNAYVNNRINLKINI